MGINIKVESCLTCPYLHEDVDRGGCNEQDNGRILHTCMHSKRIGVAHLVSSDLGSIMVEALLTNAKR